MAEYENRQNWDLNAWPEMYGTLKQLQAQIFTYVTVVQVRYPAVVDVWA